MSVTGCLLLPVTLLFMALAAAHDNSRDTYYASVGHLLVLRCYIPNAHTNVTWSSDGRMSHQPLPSGVEVREGLLLFLPVQMSHTGSYTCETRDETRIKMTFWVSVSTKNCPDPPETITIARGIREGLHCKQKELFRLNKTRKVRWMKDCGSLRKDIEVNERGIMRLPAASVEDAGKYTCLVDINLNGRKYTAARSIQLNVEKGLPETVFAEPEVLYPQDKVVLVDVGKAVDLECFIYLGFNESDSIFTYWTINSSYPEDYKEASESWKYVYKEGRVFRLLTLSISKVSRRFLNVPIRCHVLSPADKKVGLVWLQEADHNALYTTVALCLAALLAALALTAAFFLFKVDLLLAHRRLLTHFAKNEAPDGKLHDAYVSFLHPVSGSAEVASFAMQVLPEKLEKQHGYSLYIRGRDDCPGEAMHDAIATTLCQCRRLIIILSSVDPGNGDQEGELLSYNLNQLCYEQKIGLYDALTRNDPKVILVEIGVVDYSCLPESLRYIKRKQGSLKWENPACATRRLTTLFANRNFWKNMIYRLPSVPTGRLRSAV